VNERMNGDMHKCLALHKKEDCTGVICHVATSGDGWGL
jgi:hypothetical protein